MVWKTSLVCGPRKQVNCTVIEDGQLYDLSPLTRFSENYMIRAGSDVRSPMIKLNVCHSVIREAGSMCAFKSGACLAHGEQNMLVSLISVNFLLFEHYIHTQLVV